MRSKSSARQADMGLIRFPSACATLIRIKGCRLMREFADREQCARLCDE
jgi:hypothetical protein